MVRIGAIFVAVCMIVIALSLGAVAYLYFGVSAAEAAVLALGLLMAMALYSTVSARLRDRRDIGTQIADLSRGTADLARQVAELSRRVETVEAGSGKPRPISDPIVQEIGELGSLMKQLAETVAAHDAAINGGTPAASAPAVSTPKSGDLTQRLAAVSAPAAADAQPGARPASGGTDDEEMIAAVREGVEAGRIDLYLQPIVSLPQRKVRYYEALSRLRSEDGEVIAAADFIDAAEAAGVIGNIDNLALFRSVQVARRLMMKNRDIGVFCNIAGATLADSEFFPQLIEFVDANKALTGALVFEFSQATVRGMGPIEQESLAALKERGFRFSMDQVHDLRFEARDLADQGFRFVKMPAALLLSRLNDNASDIHPADLSDLLGRFGIELIADRIESEGVVVDLLDFEVRYGQGFLFSPPRPVRQEALRGASGRTQAAARQEASGSEVQPGTAEDAGIDPESPLSRRQNGLGTLARRAFDSA